MATINLQLELQKIGLGPREAKVYLAALELGPAPVQKIAQRADVARATTYLVLDDLQNKGLVTTYQEGTKTHFVIESPQLLTEFVEAKTAQLDQQKQAAKDLIPELTTRGQFTKTERPVIRYFEGPRAVNVFIQQSVARGKGEILNFVHLDKAINTLDKVDFPIERVRERRAKYKIKSRVIYTRAKGPIKDFSTKLRQAKFIPADEYPLKADISVQGNQVNLVPYGDEINGVAIEDASIAATMRTIFESLWTRLPE